MFLDSSNRPKKTPIHESAIQIMLEDKYPVWKVNYALEKLEESGYLSSIIENIKNTKKAKFYFSTKLTKKLERKKIMNRIKRSAYWINRYSDPKVTKMLGNHLHSLITAELRAQGFTILKGKDFKKYQNKWTESNNNLDIIARNAKKKLKIGVEVKNMLYLIPKDEINIKMKMCKRLGLIPVFACRWLKPYQDEIMSKGGFVWQFKNQIYPFGQEKFVEIIRKRFHLPVIVSGELPYKSVKAFQIWTNSRRGVSKYEL